MSAIALQFWFLTNYWQVNALEAIVMAVFSFFATIFWLPESPRFLYSRKRFKEAAKVMEKIASVNLIKNIQFNFKASMEHFHLV